MNEVSGEIFIPVEDVNCRHCLDFKVVNYNNPVGGEVIGFNMGWGVLKQCMACKK